MIRFIVFCRTRYGANRNAVRREIVVKAEVVRHRIQLDGSVSPAYEWSAFVLWNSLRAAGEKRTRTDGLPLGMNRHRKQFIDIFTASKKPLPPR